MFTVKTSVLALAASAGISSTQTAAPNVLPVVTLGNNNVSMSTTSSLPLHSENPTGSPFMNKLLQQKQEGTPKSKEDMMEMAIESFANNRHDKDGTNWSKFTQAEFSDIVEKGAERRQRIVVHQLVHQIDEGDAIKVKLGTFVICETASFQPVQSLVLKYTLNGKVHTHRLDCKGGEYKALQVPAAAQDVTVDKNGEGPRGLSADLKSYQSTVLEAHRISTQEEVVENIFKVLRNLEKSGDLKGLMLVAKDILKHIDKADKTGIYMRAARAATVAKEGMAEQAQAAEDLSSAEHWFEVSQKAKERAHREL